MYHTISNYSRLHFLSKSGFSYSPSSLIMRTERVRIITSYFISILFHNRPSCIMIPLSSQHNFPVTFSCHTCLSWSRALVGSTQLLVHFLSDLSSEQLPVICVCVFIVTMNVLCIVSRLCERRSWPVRVSLEFVLSR